MQFIQLRQNCLVIREYTLTGFSPSESKKRITARCSTNSQTSRGLATVEIDFEVINKTTYSDSSAKVITGSPTYCSESIVTILQNCVASTAICVSNCWITLVYKTVNHCKFSLPSETAVSIYEEYNQSYNALKDMEDEWRFYRIIFGTLVLFPCGVVCNGRVFTNFVFSKNTGNKMWNTVYY